MLRWLGLRFVLARADPELFLEELAEVLGIVEAGLVCHLTDAVSPLLQQLCRPMQAYQAYVVGRGLAGQCLQLVVEAGTAHVHQTA